MKVKRFYLGQEPIEQEWERESSKGNCEEERGVPRVLGYFSVLASKGGHELAVAYPVLYLTDAVPNYGLLFFVILAVSLLDST